MVLRTVHSGRWSTRGGSLESVAVYLIFVGDWIGTGLGIGCVTIPLSIPFVPYILDYRCPPRPPRPLHYIRIKVSWFEAFTNVLPQQ